jgi:hypothetical protein
VLKIFERIVQNVKIRYKYRSVSVGTFKDEIEAAKAYDLKAKELCGAQAKLNFPL